MLREFAPWVKSYMKHIYYHVDTKLNILKHMIQIKHTQWNIWYIKHDMKYIKHMIDNETDETYDIWNMIHNKTDDTYET